MAIRIGILGAGHFAEAHLTALAALENRVRVVMVGRGRPKEPCPLATSLGAALKSPAEVLSSDEVDAVIVCTPNHLHAPHAIAALAADKHVFCEKPMALSLEDADAMIAAAQESGKVLMIGHLTRHMSLYTKVAKILQNGRLGPPRAAYLARLQVGASERSWRMDPELGGGVAFDLLIHDLDLMLWYLGRPHSVTARGHRHPQGAFDYLAALYTFSDNTTTVAEGSFLLPAGAGLRAQLRITCDGGHLEVNTTDHEFPIRVLEKGREEERIHVAMESLRNEALRSELTEFIDAATGTPPQHLRLADARQALECALLTVDSAARKTEVIFPAPCKLGF